MLALHVEIGMLLLAPKHLVDGQRESIVEHAGQQFLQHWGGLFDAGVGVDLNQPRVALVVKHEVVTEYLKAKITLLLVYLFLHTQSSYFYNSFDHIHKLLITLSPYLD